MIDFFQVRPKNQEEITEQLTESDSDLEMIVTSHQPEIATYNRLELLEEEECEFYMIEDDLKRKHLTDNISQFKSKVVSKSRKKKVKEICLKIFETKNRFSVLEDNPEE